MTLRSGHVEESRLFASYVDERAGEPLDPRLVDHLATCAECAGRFHNMAAMMHEACASAGGHERNRREYCASWRAEAMASIGA